MLVGVVGKANVGKSTFFRAATLAPAQIGPFPFVTIEPNKAIAYAKTECPCTELKIKCNPNNSMCLNGNRFVPFEILDVAGLIPGAHLGKGLGNKFLDDLRRADCLIHVLDASGSTDEKGNQIAPGKRNPSEDLKFLKEEFDFWLQNILMKHFKDKKQKFDQYSVEQVLSGLKMNKEHIAKALKKTELDISKISKWTDEQFLTFAIGIRYESKPVIICANKCDLKIGVENLKELKEKNPGDIFVPCSAESELVLREAAEKNMIEYVPGESDFEIVGDTSKKQKDALEFVRKKVLAVLGSTGVQECLNKAVFDMLNFIVVYPVEDENKLTDGNGRVLPDAYLIKNGSTPLDLAHKIHSEIGDNFIGAIDCKTGKKIGKGTRLKNNDIIKIMVKK